MAEWITAGGTIALVAATAVLAWLTWLLARSTSQPSLIATIETNDWAFQYLDLHLTNEGNASAFDIELNFDPPLPNRHEDMQVGGFRSVSVLRADQHLVTNLGKYTLLEGKIFTVTISWRRKPKRKREQISYSLDMSYLDGVTRLGSGSPAHVIAQEAKKIREELAKRRT